MAYFILKHSDNRISDLVRSDFVCRYSDKIYPYYSGLTVSTHGFWRRLISWSSVAICLEPVQPRG